MLKTFSNIGSGSLLAPHRGLKLLFLGLVAIPALFANTYYVATNGSDSAAGTLTAPFRTVSHGTAVAQAGDTLYIRGGVYQEAVVLSHSGTASSPITISGYPGETAILDGNNMTIPAQNGGGALILGTGINYLNIENLTVRNSGYQGITIQGTYLTVDHVTGYGNWGDAVQLWGSYVTISNSISHDNSQGNLNGRSAGQYGGSLGCGIYTGPVTDHCAITNNIAYNDWGDGLELMNATQSTMTGNVSYNEWQEQIYIQNTTYSIIDGNLSYVTAGNPLSGSGGPQHNIHIGDETGKPNTCQNLTITNNFAMGGRTVLLLSVAGVLNDVIANNTFVNASSWNGVSTVYINSGANGGSLFENNIIEQDDSLPTDTVGSGGGITFSHNLWSKSPSMGTSSGDIVANPQLAETGSTTAGSLSPDWFKLLAGSPAIGKALVLSQVTDDFFQTPRGQYPDIGGDQYSSTSSADTSAPTTPTGLTVTGTTSSGISINWNASTDNVAVTGYRVYRNASQITTTTGTTFSDTGLSASTTYYYSVAAYDASGNVSPVSAQVSGTTTAAVNGTTSGGSSVPLAIQILTPANGAAIPLGTQINMTGAATDGVQVTSMKWTVDGVTVSNSSFALTSSGATTQATWTPTSAAGWQPGYYTIGLSATDAAGTTAQTSITIQLTSSTTTSTSTSTPLSVQILSPANGATLPPGTQISMTGAATDGVQVTSMKWTVDGVTVTNSSFALTSSGATTQATWTPNNARHGSHTIGLTATDAGGKTVQTSITIRLK